MSVGPVAVTTRCEECRRLWLSAAGERWEAYRLDVLLEEPEDRIAFWCPQRVEREFREEAR